MAATGSSAGKRRARGLPTRTAGGQEAAKWMDTAPHESYLQLIAESRQLECQECAQPARGQAHGWEAHLCDIDDDGAVEILFYCPSCADREFHCPPVPGSAFDDAA